MEERVYDLNGREGCVRAVIKVVDREFRISRVVNAVRVSYSNLLRRMGELMKEIGSLDPETMSEEDLKAMTSRVDAFAEERERTEDLCLRLLLEKNGIDYDRRWWSENTDEHDIRGFIEACLSKDASGSKKK